MNIITMVVVPRRLHYYTSAIVRKIIGDWLATTSNSPNEQQVLVQYLIHIYLFFPTLQGCLILPITLRLLEKLILCFDNELGSLTASFIECVYHFVLGEYEYLTELSPNYVLTLSPVYFNRTTNRTNMF